MPKRNPQSTIMNETKNGAGRHSLDNSNKPSKGADASARESTAHVHVSPSALVGSSPIEPSPSSLASSGQTATTAEPNGTSDMEKSGVFGKIASAVEPVKERVTSAVEPVQQTVSSAVDKVREGVGEVQATVQATVQGVVEKVQTATHDGAEKAREVVQHGTDIAKEMVHQATDTASEMVHTGSEKARVAAHDVGEAAQLVGSTVVSTVRRHPLPCAMIAAGVGWLAYCLASDTSTSTATTTPTPTNGKTKGANGNGKTKGDGKHAMKEVAEATTETASEAAGVKAKIGDMAHRASDTIGTVAHGAADRAAHLVVDAKHYAGEAMTGTRNVVHSAEEQLRRTTSAVRHAVQENPLAFGAASMAVGTAIGLALPHTVREDGLLGEARDKLVQKVENLAERAVEDNVVGRVARAFVKGSSKTEETTSEVHA